MLLRSAFLVCCAVATVLGKENHDARRAAPAYYDTQDYDYQSRVAPREEYITSHRIPDSAVRYASEEVGRDIKIGKAEKKVAPRFETLDKRTNIDKDENNGEPRKKSRIELENFSDSGVLYEDGIRKVDVHKPRPEYQRESVIPGVYVSHEYPTTMVPILTTPRDTRSFDFIPVNIIPEDNKNGYRSFGDLSDVSLVPAGSNSRIQVKKGPNGKDYEYEYVYYYYDEEDEGKSSSVSSSYEGSPRTTPAPRRGAPSNNRNKYSPVERPTTVEPVNNEVIPRGTSNRSRQLADSESVSEERLPTNTRFPPRSRSNHNTGTTEPSRARGNRPRPNLDLVDSSSFRTHQEGPEFPQVLPKGPVRFIGVTPNEDTEDRPIVRSRGRPQRVQEPVIAEEPAEDSVSIYRRRPVHVDEAEADIELSKGQPTRPFSSEEDEEESRTRASSHGDKKLETDYDSTTTDNPTTEFPSAMDKVALDLYAFLQQGQSNLVDASVDSLGSGEGTTPSDEESTTDSASTTEFSGTTVFTTESTTTTTTTTTPKPTTTTTTTTTEAPTTPQLVGRGKFKRPAVHGGAPISRNRFKSNNANNNTPHNSASSTEAPSEPTQRTRGRFGNNNGNSGFKRSRPGQKAPAVEEVHKEAASGTVNAERPTTSRSRFRGSSYRNSASTTASSVNSAAPDSSVGASRPAFNKLNINRRRGRPTTAPPTTQDESQEVSETGQTEIHEVSTTPKPALGQRGRLPVGGPRPIRPAVTRVNLRPRPGQLTSTTAAPEVAPEVTPEEPTGEGTEDESHEAPAETSSTAKPTTANPLNKLRSKNRLQVHPKTTTRAPVSAPRRSPLLPRRKTTEAPTEEPLPEEPKEEEHSEEAEPTDAPLPETSPAPTTKEEPRGLSSLLAPRRRVSNRRPGQLLATRDQ